MEQISKWFPVTAKQQELFEQLYHLHVTCPINVTAIKDEDSFLKKHLLDSIMILSMKDVQAKTMCDIGSGGGFPGVALAIVRPEWQITLVDSIGKKCAFLELVAKELKLRNVTVIHGRAEKIQKKTFDLITARGVSTVRDVINWTWSISHPKSSWIMYKGEKLQEELAEAASILKNKELAVETYRVEEPFTRTYCCLRRGAPRS